MKDDKLKLAGILVAGFLVVTAAVATIYPAWYQNYAPVQPIPFSHKLHAGKYNMPCEYCHSQNTDARYMEVPGVGVCMNCHSVVKTESPYIQKIKKAYDEGVQIPWIKVHTVADYVRFNHGRHIEAGLDCEVCHGPVEEMERVYQFERLTMGWCIDCHRNDDYLTPHRIELAKKRNELQGNPERTFVDDLMLAHPEVQNADVSCSTCHY